MAGLMDQYNFAREKIPDAGWDKFVRMCVLRDIEERKLPERARIAGNLPFNLEPEERVVWLFDNTEYLEDRTVRSHSNYGGVSVRVAPGVYVHGGESARAAASEGFVSVDYGMLAFSDRAVLFQGQHRAIRFKYKDIASFARYDYGFSICKGTQTARPIGFVTRDVSPGFPDLLLRGLCRLYMESGAPHSRRSRRTDEVAD